MTDPSSSLKKLETSSSPEKQKQTSQSAANVVTQVVGVGGFSGTTPTPTSTSTQIPQQQQSETFVSVGSSVIPPPTTQAFTQLTQMRQTETVVTGGYSSTIPPYRPYDIGHEGTSNSQNIANIVQTIDCYGGIVSTLEHENVVVAQQKKKRKPAEMNVPETMRPVCCVCGRSFRSWKALFGHMRSHPDRQWRGCFPPPIQEQLDVAIINAANGQGIVLIYTNFVIYIYIVSHNFGSGHVK